MNEQRRAPVQANGKPRRQRTGEDGDYPGSVDWSEHVETWTDYARRYGTDQSAERIAERGGFGYAEIVLHLGHKPKTWRPR